MLAAPEFLIGTSGYSFADWVGPFYPPGTPATEYLPYYARQFGCVEVNATYYRLPQASTMQRMHERTPEGFRFIVKLHQSMTHQGADELLLYDNFMQALQPLKDAGKYHGLLAQFPWAFRRDERAKAHLERMRERLGDEPLWVEFRHDSWMHPKLADWLRERALGYCCVDEPALPGLVPPVTHVTNGIGYVRFHGRNAKHWWGSGTRAGAPDAATPAVAPEIAPLFSGEPAAPAAAKPERRPAANREQLRYDYDYSESELMQWAAKLSELARQAKQTYLFFNNCHAGQAARNAKLMEELLRRQGSLGS
ncbi:MAG: DUF72 domain-containing protein [Candidatus Eisenbacteria bacterium]